MSTTTVLCYFVFTYYYSIKLISRLSGKFCTNRELVHVFEYKATIRLWSRAGNRRDRRVTVYTCIYVPSPPEKVKMMVKNRACPLMNTILNVLSTLRPSKRSPRRGDRVRSPGNRKNSYKIRSYPRDYLII